MTLLRGISSLPLKIAAAPAKASLLRRRTRLSHMPHSRTRGHYHHREVGLPHMLPLGRAYWRDSP